MNIWKLCIGVCVLVEALTLTRWLVDGRQMLTKQQMLVERIVQDEVFGTNITKTEVIQGFWLGLDVAAPVMLICAFGIVVTARRLRHL